MMGMASERLLPFTPWQAAQVMTLASGESNGPGAEAGPWARAGAAGSTIANPASTTTARRRMVDMGSPCLSDHVGPDALRPALGPGRHRRVLGRRQPLLDLHHLAALDLVRVDHRDRLRIAHPAIAGIAGG